MDRYEHAANLQIENHLAGSGVIMKQTDPFRFFGKFKWIDGHRLLRSDEDGRPQNAMIYSRYAIADEGMLKDAALKLRNLHASDETRRAKVRSIKN